MNYESPCFSLCCAGVRQPLLLFLLTRDCQNTAEAQAWTRPRQTNPRAAADANPSTSPFLHTYVTACPCSTIQCLARTGQKRDLKENSTTSSDRLALLDPMKGRSKQALPKQERCAHKAEGCARIYSVSCGVVSETPLNKTPEDDGGYGGSLSARADICCS